MPYTLLNSVDSVQVYGPDLVSETLVCTILSGPSGSTLLRTVPAAEFQSDQGQGILSSLSDAVEQILQAGTATAAVGNQRVDPSGLLADYVDFTVTYVPPSPVPGSIDAVVSIPVNVLTADTSFGSFLGGGSAADQIQATYDRLKAMATG